MSGGICARPAGSVEAAVAQVIRYDHVGDCVEHELDVVRVRRARHVTVNFFGCRLVLRLELGLDVRRRLAVLLRPCKQISLDTSY